MWRGFILVALVLALTLAPAAVVRATSDPPDLGASISTTPGDESPPITTALGADDRWHASPVAITFTASSAVASVTATWVQVDGGGAVATKSIVVVAPSDHRNDGIHTLTYWSVDADGRTEAPQTLAVKIDTAAPVVRDLRLAPTVLRRLAPIHLNLTLADISGSTSASVAVRDQYGFLAHSFVTGTLSAGQQTLRVIPRYRNGRAFDPGLYHVSLTFIDEAGNRTVARTLSFRDYHPVRAHVTHHVRGAGRRVALTFDDGGSPWVWTSILNSLRAYHMHATFFLLGPYVAAAPAVARRTVREGHGIGSHGWTHSEMQRQGYAGVRRELLRSEGPWWYAARATPVSYFRPPYGSQNRETVAAAGSLGYSHVVLWDIDPGDWRGYGAGTIAANTLSHVHSGAIIGLHVCPATAAALPAILRGLRARRYESVSLPELFHAAGRR